MSTNTIIKKPMKNYTNNIFFLIIFVLLGLGANAQGSVVGVHAFTSDLKATATSDDGHYSVAAANLAGPDGEVVIIDHWNNNYIVQQDTITPGGSGSNWSIVFYTKAAIDNSGNAYVMYAYHTRADNIVENRIHKFNSNGTNEVIMTLGGAGPQAMKHKEDNLYIMLGADSVYGFDPMSSGLPYFDDYLFVSIDTATNGINYTQEWDETFWNIIEMVDGNLLVLKENRADLGYYAIVNPSNGDILIQEDNPEDVDVYYDKFKNKLLFSNAVEKKTTYHEFDGTLIIPEMDFEYTQWDNPMGRITAFEDGYIGFGGGDVFFFDNRVDQSFNLNSIHNRNEKITYIGAINWMSGGQVLYASKEFCIRVVNYSGSGREFGGVTLPDATNGNGWFVYTESYQPPTGGITINNISTHNIVGIVENAYLSEVNSGYFIYDNPDIAVNYAIVEDGFVPQVGTDVRNWGLWSVSSNFTEFDAPGIGVVREDVFGRRYVDIAPYDVDNHFLVNERIYFVSENDVTIDVTSLEKQNISIYPNPANDVVNIEVGDGKLLNVEVYNAVGKKVLNKKINRLSKVVVNVNSLIGGIYMMVITTEQGSLVQRLMIE